MNRYENIVFPPTPFPLETHLILAGKRGSEAHGTYIPSTDGGIDDRDVLGVVIAPMSYYIGLHTWNHAEHQEGVWDVVLYDIRKFIGLCVNQNPNALCFLWNVEEDYTHITPVGRALLETRLHLRARQPAYDAFMGYARGQLKRMTSFGQYRGYMGAKRKALVDRFGWDTKNGAHLIRLLHMGFEYLQTGVLTVRRTQDAAHIIAIKQGKVTLADVQSEAEELFNRCETLLPHSALPERIDREKVNTLLTNLVLTFHNNPGTIIS